MILMMTTLVLAENEPGENSESTKMIVQPDRMVSLEEKAEQIIELDPEQGEITATLMDEEGLIYLFTSSGHYMTLNSQGQIISSVQTEINIESEQIMLSGNSSLYLSDGNNTRVLYKDGGERLTYDKPFIHYAQAKDGMTVLLTKTGDLMATDINGEIMWERRLEGHFSTGLCIGINKSIITFSDTGKFYMIQQTGEIIESKETGIIPATTPIVDMNGELYLGIKASKLVKFTYNGEKAWETNTAGVVVNQPVFDFSGNVIYATTGGLVCSVKKKTALENWKFYTDGGIPTGLSLSQNKDIYFTTTKNKAYVLSADAILKWKSEADASFSLSPVLKDKDTVVIPAKNKIYILHENTGGIAKSAWTCLHGNQQRTQTLFTPTLHRLSTVPYDPTPLNGETKTQRTVTFKWELDMETTVDFYLGTHFPLTRCGINIKDNTITIPNLSPNTVYYWRVEPRTDIPNQAIPNWTFRTGE